MLLEVDSYRVETATNGLEALLRLREGGIPDVVLLDLQMPQMNGVLTLRRLLKLHPALKVIMCSALADPWRIQEAKLLGAQAYLTKPVQHLYLTAALEGCLHGRQQSECSRTEIAASNLWLETTLISREQARRGPGVWRGKVLQSLAFPHFL